MVRGLHPAHQVNDLRTGDDGATAYTGQAQGLRNGAQNHDMRILGDPVAPGVLAGELGIGGVHDYQRPPVSELHELKDIAAIHQIAGGVVG